MFKVWHLKEPAPAHASVNGWLKSADWGGAGCDSVPIMSDMPRSRPQMVVLARNSDWVGDWHLHFCFMSEIPQHALFLLEHQHDSTPALN